MLKKTSFQNFQSIFYTAKLCIILWYCSIGNKCVIFFLDPWELKHGAVLSQYQYTIVYVTLLWYSFFYGFATKLDQKDENLKLSADPSCRICEYIPLGIIICFPFSFSQISTNLPNYLSSSTIGAQRTQPFVLILGERGNPSQVYLVFERRTYPFKTVIKAIDVCFKIFYVFDIDYPSQCKSTWQFIQQCLYEIRDEQRDDTPPAVRMLRTFILNKQKWTIGLKFK